MTKADLEKQVKELQARVDDLEGQVALADEAYEELEAELASAVRREDKSMGTWEDVKYAMIKDGILTPALEQWFENYLKFKED